MDTTTKAVIETIGDAGYSVMTGRDSDGVTRTQAEEFIAKVRADARDAVPDHR